MAQIYACWYFLLNKHISKCVTETKKHIVIQTEVLNSFHSLHNIADTEVESLVKLPVAFSVYVIMDNKPIFPYMLMTKIA